MLRIAIIGAGRIGVVHARSVLAHPGAALAVVADPDLAAAQRLAETSPGARAVSDAAEVFAAPDVDAVIIGSPTRFHVPQILAALDAGQAVLVEKPVELDMARLDECLEAAGERANRVMVGFNRRFDPSLAQVHTRVQAGEIGPLQQLTITSRDPAPPPEAYLAGSGGIFRDMTIHDFDMARHLLGEIASVHAVGVSTRPETAAAGDFDQAVTTLTGVDGGVATIINSRQSATGYDQRLEAFGPLGSLEVGNATPTLVRANGAGGSGMADPYLHFFLERYAAAYSAELDRFLTSVHTGVNPGPTLLDGRKALELANAATESATTGMPVNLDAGATRPGARSSA